MFFLLVPTCTLIITREIMSEKTIRAVIEIAPEIIEDKTVEGSKQSIAETFIHKKHSLLSLHSLRNAYVTMQSK